MKTKIVLLFLLGWAGMISAQKIGNKESFKENGNSNIESVEENRCRNRKNQEVIYNFSTGTFEKSIIKPCQGVPMMLKIKNINTYFYDVQIQSKDISIDSEDLSDPSLYIKKTGIIKIDTTAVLGILDTKFISVIPTAVNSETPKNKSNALEEIKEKEKVLEKNNISLQKSKDDLYEFEMEKKEIENLEILKKDINTIETLPDSLRIKNAKILATKKK